MTEFEALRRFAQRTDHPLAPHVRTLLDAYDQRGHQLDQMEADIAERDRHVLCGGIPPRPGANWWKPSPGYKTVATDPGVPS